MGMIDADYGWSVYGMLGMHVWMGEPQEATFSTGGITTVDMHLTVAECLIRSGDLSGAKTVLERIRQNRILTDRYTPSPASSRAEMIALLKQLSRSENFFSFKDFINLKRWNTDPDFAETLVRNISWTVQTTPPTPPFTGPIESRTYTLSPNSPLWIYPFPQNATSHNPNLTQNF
jgi:hypothetical protein